MCVCVCVCERAKVYERLSQPASQPPIVIVWLCDGNSFAHSNMFATLVPWGTVKSTIQRVTHESTTNRRKSRRKERRKATMTMTTTLMLSAEAEARFSTQCKKMLLFRSQQMCTHLMWLLRVLRNVAMWTNERVVATVAIVLHDKQINYKNAIFKMSSANMLLLTETAKYTHHHMNANILYTSEPTVRNEI